MAIEAAKTPVRVQFQKPHHLDSSRSSRRLIKHVQLRTNGIGRPNDPVRLRFEASP